MPNNRVEVIKQRLAERGVTDIKICWSGIAAALPDSVLADDLCYMLEAYLDGRTQLFEGIGDSVRVQQSSADGNAATDPQEFYTRSALERSLALPAVTTDRSE